jgi:hypothetical protein
MLGRWNIIEKRYLKICEDNCGISENTFKTDDNMDYESMHPFKNNKE